jgi:hypothetical protein
MKKLTLLGLTGVASLTLGHAGLAADRGGGESFHGSGFARPHFESGAVARENSPGFGTGNRSGLSRPRVGLPYGHFATIPPGYNFAPAGMRQAETRQPVFAGHTSRGRAVFNGRVGNESAGRSISPSGSGNQGTTASSARPSQAIPHGLNGRTDHISRRHPASWHGDWDRHHAHFHNGQFFVFFDDSWFGLDDGIFPWDYLPYYANDYYPYDYYTDDDSAAVDDNAETTDPTVEAVQTELSKFGYYNGPIDGIFGPTTRDAVAKYQIANQLNITGSLSPDTLLALGLPQAAKS